MNSQQIPPPHRKTLKNGLGGVVVSVCHSVIYKFQFCPFSGLPHRVHKLHTIMYMILGTFGSRWGRWDGGGNVIKQTFRNFQQLCLCAVWAVRAVISPTSARCSVNVHAGARAGLLFVLPLARARTQHSRHER